MVVGLILFVILCCVWGCNSLRYDISEFMSPPRIEFSGVTPMEFKAAKYSKMSADGPYRLSLSDETGVTWSGDFDSKGQCVSGCVNAPSFSHDMVFHITSLDAGREVHFTFTECRVRETIGRSILDCG